MTSPAGSTPSGDRWLQDDACKTRSPGKGVSDTSWGAAPAECTHPGTLAAPSISPAGPRVEAGLPRDGGAQPGPPQMLPTRLPRGPGGPPGNRAGWGGASTLSVGSVPTVTDRAHARHLGGILGSASGAGRVREEPGRAHTRKQESAPRATGTRGPRGPPAGRFAASAGVP